MNVKIAKPAFITFTGVDRPELLPGMIELAANYPIEWGILIDPAQEEHPLFPARDEISKIVSSPLRFSAHVCGKPAIAIANGHNPDINLSGFSRLQLNHSREGSDEQAIANAYAYAVSTGLRLALQCQGDFPVDSRCDWLYDVSFGTGIKVTEWPTIDEIFPFYGFSGGLSAKTVKDALANFKITSDPLANFWIDMESGVRTDDLFDLDKCKQICELVYD